jgi:anti-sigma B factor antagonist
LGEPEFTVKASTAGPRHVHVAGELDVAVSAELSAALVEYVSAGGDLTIDMSEVTFMDSTAIGVLVRAHNELSASGARLTITNPSTVVLRILQLTGLVALLHADIAET